MCVSLYAMKAKGSSKDFHQRRANQMSINLKRGQSVNLQREFPNLKRIRIGLGWSVKKFAGFGVGSEISVDASVICISSGKWHDSTVCYKRLKHRSGAIVHYGDELAEGGKGDKKQIDIYLDKLPNNIEKLSIVINIYAAYERNQDFRQVRNCFIHVDDLETEELFRCDIDGKFEGLTGMFVAEFYRDGNSWIFKPIGEGVRVQDIVEMEKMLCP